MSSLLMSGSLIDFRCWSAPLVICRTLSALSCLMCAPQQCQNGRWQEKKQWVIWEVQWFGGYLKLFSLSLAKSRKTDPITISLILIIKGIQVEIALTRTRIMLIHEISCLTSVRCEENIATSHCYCDSLWMPVAVCAPWWQIQKESDINQ